MPENATAKKPTLKTGLSKKTHFGAPRVGLYKKRDYFIYTITSDSRCQLVRETLHIFDRLASTVTAIASGSQAKHIKKP
jgi:hypothetical protein